MRWAVLLLVGLGGCDDSVLLPCGALTADWHGVNCTVQVHCISCHATVSDRPPVQYTVLPYDLYADLIEERGELVVPGDPEASLLWRTLSGELRPGDTWGIMPWGAFSPLPDEQIVHVREWIEAGAEIEAGL